MALFFISILAIFGTGGADGPPWWNIPGLEAWKFLNLGLLLIALVYFLRRPLSDAMRARREGIRRDLNRAREERDAALAKLQEVEARLGKLNGEVALLAENAKREGQEEAERIGRLTEEESLKLREQAKREIESAAKAAKQELRRFAASESVRLAEEIIRREMSAADDLRLVNLEVQELGGIRK